LNAQTPARLLFVGDIHLGRRPGSLPDDLGEYGIDASALTPVAAWQRTVEQARRLATGSQGLLAVVLAGDVVESLEDRFEAFAHLETGIRRIVEAGVRVYAVAGNHDVEALPRLADRIDGFVLLGRGGSWERASLATPAGGIDLLGWSFPERVVRESPLASLPEDLASGERPTLGVLHCDLDGGASPYAPVSRASLERTSADAWLLGHVHAPSRLDGSRPIGYLGSLVGLDPGEPGPHGPWLVEVAGRGSVRAHQLPLAPLRFEREVIALSDEALCAAGSDPESVRDALHAEGVAALERVARRIGEAADSTRAVGVRLVLEGRTRFRSLIRGWRGDRRAWPSSSPPSCHLFTEAFEDRTRPAVDLEALARGADPPALLARRLLAIERGEDAGTALVAEAERRLATQRSDPRWSGLADADPSERQEDARDRLLRCGLDSLDGLLAQQARDGARP